MYHSRRQSQSPMADSGSFHDDRSYMGNEAIQTLRVKLSKNLIKLTEDLLERKELILKLAEILMSENSSKLEHVARAKLSELKNEARMMKDHSTVRLIEDAEINKQSGSSQKGILELIMSKNPKNIEIDTQRKMKEYYEELAVIDRNRSTTMNKFKNQSAELKKHIEQEKRYFKDIEYLEQEKINILTAGISEKNYRNNHDHIKKAEKIEDEIDRYKLILKNNKVSKDKKKAQISAEIQSIIEDTRQIAKIIEQRYQQISQVFGGYETIQEFDVFYKNFQTVVSNKVTDENVSEKIVKDIVKFAKYFQDLAEEQQKFGNEEMSMFDELQNAYRKNVTLSILERAYLSDLPTDKNSLIGIVNQFKAYRSMLVNLTDQRNKAIEEKRNAKRILDYFEPELKTIETQEKRREKLIERIDKIMISKTELDRMESLQNDHELQLSNMLLQKQALQRQQQESGRRGNLTEYKQRTQQLEKIEAEIQHYTQNKSVNHGKGEEQARLNNEIQQINREYSDIIEEIIVEEKEMSCGVFLDKLSKRLSLI